MFSVVIEVFDVIVEDGSNSEQRAEAFHLLESMQSFEFLFTLHLMRALLRITNDLSQVLQRKDQDIVNAMKLVQTSKQRLQMLRDNGWSPLVDEVSSFCEKYQIIVPNMDETYVIRGRSRRRAQDKTKYHHYHVELFYTTVDMQIQELNNRFNEVNTELLLCVACLNPVDSFAAFDKKKLIRFAKFYSNDFSDAKILTISDQLENFILDVRSSIGFSDLKGIENLAQKMVKTKKDKRYPSVYKLLMLALILSVATATVDMAFSVMKIVKSRLRNRMVING